VTSPLAARSSRSETKFSSSKGPAQAGPFGVLV
jgi:hypothetical protein